MFDNIVVSNFMISLIIGLIIVLVMLIFAIKNAEYYIRNKLEYKIMEIFRYKKEEFDCILNNYENYLEKMKTDNNHVFVQYNKIFKNLNYYAEKFKNIDTDVSNAIENSIIEGYSEYSNNLADVVMKYEIISKTINSTVDDFSIEFSKFKDEANNMVNLLAEIKKLENRLERRNENDDRNFQEYRN